MNLRYCGVVLFEGNYTPAKASNKEPPIDTETHQYDLDFGFRAITTALGMLGIAIQIVDILFYLNRART